MVFWQKRGEPFAVLLHHDLDWEPVRIQERMLRLGLIPSIGDLVLNEAEAYWLMGRFKATEWWRRPAGIEPHGLTPGGSARRRVMRAAIP